MLVSSSTVMGLCCIRIKYNHREINSLYFHGAIENDVSKAAVCHRGGCWSFLVTGISCEVRPWGVNTEYERSGLLQEKVSHTLHLVCKWISWQIKWDLRVKRGWERFNSHNNRFLNPKNFLTCVGYFGFRKNSMTNAENNLLTVF